MSVPFVLLFEISTRRVAKDLKNCLTGLAALFLFACAVVMTTGTEGHDREVGALKLQNAGARKGT